MLKFGESAFVALSCNVGFGRCWEELCFYLFSECWAFLFFEHSALFWSFESGICKVRARSQVGIIWCCVVWVKVWHRISWLVRRWEIICLGVICRTEGIRCIVGVSGVYIVSEIKIISVGVTVSCIKIVCVVECLRLLVGLLGARSFVNKLVQQRRLFLFRRVVVDSFIGGLFQGIILVKDTLIFIPGRRIVGYNHRLSDKAFVSFHSDIQVVVFTKVQTRS